MPEEKQNINQNESDEPNETSARGTSKPGSGWHGDSEGHAQAGRRGGVSVSKDRKHMAEIGRKGGEARKIALGSHGYSELGRKGGEAVAREKGSKFFSEIGRKGGEEVSRDREHMSEIGRKGGHSSGTGGSAGPSEKPAEDSDEGKNLE